MQRRCWRSSARCCWPGSSPRSPAWSPGQPGWALASLGNAGVSAPVAPAILHG